MSSPAPASTPGSVGSVQIVRLVREGAAVTRSALAGQTGLSVSAVHRRVDQLTRAGILTETGSAVSVGGRPSRELAVDGRYGVVAAATMSDATIQVTLADLNGEVLSSTSHPHQAGDGPEATMTRFWQQLQQAVAELPGRSDPLAICLGIPSSVVPGSGELAFPFFMPSWHRANPGALVAGHTEVPVLVANSADLIAVAESRGARDRPVVEQLLAVQLGERIGCGVISNGSLHRGASGAAGEISHVPVGIPSVIPCACGIPQCLESVASGKAVLAAVADQGLEVDDLEQLVAASRAGDAVAATALRRAGSEIGAVLATIVNFFNPSEVVIAGELSTSEVLVSAIRAELFARCLQVVTHDLLVRASAEPLAVTTAGAVVLAQEAALTEAARRVGTN